MTPTPRFSSLVVGYVAGLVLGHTGRVPVAMTVVMSIVVILMVWRTGRGVLLAVVVVGAAAGAVRWRDATRECAAMWTPGARVSFVARVHDAPGPRLVTTASVEQAKEGCGGQVRLGAAADLRAGALVIIVGSHRSRGVVRIRHARALPASRSIRFVIREALSDRLASLYGDRTPLIEAMVLGRKHDLEPEIRNQFAAAGLAHLLAISGLHVGIVALWVGWILRRLQLGHRANLVSVPVIWGYVALLGFPAPATRAATFLTAYALARWYQRHPPPSAVLALGVAVVCMIDPAAVRSVGAWLSAAAVWGVYQGTAIVRRHTPLEHPMIRLLAASTGATLATAPITAFAFGQVAPIGVVANLLGVPLAGVAVPTVVTSLVAGSPMASGAALSLTLLERWVDLVTNIPFGLSAGAAGFSFALPWMALLLATWWAFRVQNRTQLVRAAFVVVGVMAWMPATLQFVRRDRDDASLAMHVLDVGQGDAIAIRTPAGHWLLVDTGPRGPAGDAGRRVISPFFRRRGVKRLTALFVSHGDADHVGGAPSVLREIGAELVLEPGQPLPSTVYLQYLGAVDASGATWRAARSGDSLEVDGVSVKVLHPTAHWLQTDTRPNEGSLVLLVRYQCFEALLTGDAGLPVEEALSGTIPAVDVLKVGHHGSRTATSADFVKRVEPQVAVISVGRNTYGHPAPDVVALLEAQSVAVYRTDRDGTVTLRTDGRYLEVDPDRRTSIAEEISCLGHWLRLSASSSSRSACTRKQRVSLPICSTTSRSLPKSFPGTSGVRD